LSAIRLLDSTSRRDRQRVNHAVAVDEAHRVDEIRDDARMIRDDVDAIAGLECGAAGHAHRGMFFREALDQQRVVDAAR